MFLSTRFQGKNFARHVWNYNKLGLPISRSAYIQATGTGIQMRRRQVSKNMVHIWDESNTSETKPIVVLFSWLMAQEKHFTIFHDYYLSRNFDVVKLQISPHHVLMPTKIKPITRSALDFLSRPEHSKKPILFHGFSIGGYLYTDSVLYITREPEKYEALGKRLIGHVSDSVADMDGATRGIGMSLTNSKVLAEFLRWSLQAYIDAFPKKVLYHFELSTETYLNNPLRLPTQFFHSCGDKVNTPAIPKRAMEIFKEKNIPGFYHEFDTPHCQHFKRNPEKYAEIMDTFLGFIWTRNNIKF